MDDFSNQYVKQVCFSSEQEFITIKPRLSITNLAHKIQPCLNGKEPIDKSQTPTASSSVVAPVSNGTTHTKNATNSFTNDFIVHELEDTPPMSKANIQDTNNFQSGATVLIKMPSPRLLNIINDNRSVGRHSEPFKNVGAAVETLRNCGAILKKSVTSPSPSIAGEPKILNGHFKGKTTNRNNVDCQQSRKSQPLGSVLKANIVEAPAVASQAVSPPILLNTQLGKRRYESIESTKTQKSFTNKKKCYNLEGVEQTQANGLSIKPKKVFNNACKKIINYIMKKKKYHLDLQTREKQVEKQTEKDLGKGNNKLQSSFIITKNSSTSAANMPIKSEKLDDNQQVANMNALSQSVTITSPSANNASYSLDTLEPVSIKQENIETDNLNTSRTISQTPDLSAEEASAPLATIPLLTCKNKPLKSVESISSKPRCELKVKCLCRLMGDTNDANLAPYGREELKNFFHQMFEETRKLKRQDQRKVKMSLLQTVCEAEEMMERGKCCCF